MAHGLLHCRQEICMGGGAHCSDQDLPEVRHSLPQKVNCMSVSLSAQLCLWQMAQNHADADNAVCLLCRIDFKLSPGQVPLAVRSPFTLGPAKGIFVTPVLRVEE